MLQQIKKAAKWYFDHAAENYVWSPKPLNHPYHPDESAE